MFLGKSKAVLAAIGILVSLSIAPSPASADTSLDVSQVNLQAAPGTVAPTEVTFSDNGGVCFAFTSSASSLEFSQFELTYNLVGLDFVEEIYEYPTKSGNKFTVCHEIWSINSLDIPSVTNWALKGTVRQPTTVSANFAAYLAGKKLTLDSLFIWDNGSTTYLDLNLSNKTSTPLAYSVKNLKFNNKTVANPATSIVVPAKTQTWLQLGSVEGAYEKGGLNVPLTLALTPVKFSTVVPTKLTLPKGLIVAKDSAARFDYMGYNKTTNPCINLKNTTTKTISVMSTFTWKSGTKTITGNYGQLISIEKNATACISGIDDNDLGFAGDKRTGQSLTVTGKVVAVAETKFDTKGIKLNGYKISQSPRMYYDPVTKSTQIYVFVTSTDLDGDAVLNAPKVNGVQTDGSVVSIPCECGGEGFDNRSRTLSLTKIKGDLRVGKLLKLSGTLANSTPMTVNSEIEGLMTDDYSARCFVYHAQESSYDSKTNLTKFKFLCVNNTTTSKTFDLSGLEALAEVEGSAPATYTSLSTLKNVVIPANTNKWITVFEMLGDWRTGAKTLTITGTGSVR